MSRFEPTLVMREEGRYRTSSRETDNPSFSSTLLDKIYRSIDEGDVRRDDLRFHRDAVSRKHSVKCYRQKPLREEEEEEEDLRQRMMGSRRDALVQKWGQKNTTVRKEMDERKEVFTEFQTRLRYEQELDQDYLCFSSTSSSSDSSSGVFSSSDTESIHGSNSIVSSCFIPTKPKPIKTNVSEKNKKTEKKRRALFSEQGKTHTFGQSLNKSKERAMEIYGNLKKVRPPVSPSARLTNFLNALFTSGNNRKKTSSNSSPSNASCYDGRKIKSEQVSTCSSASSFSRSCLSKHSPSTRERMRNGVKRTVRFCPVSVIVDEDSRPYGHKQVYGKGEEERRRPPTAPAADRAIRREEEGKTKPSEKSRRVEEMAREFLREYHKNNRKSVEEEEDEDEDEDAWSYSSSDLFELDHLSAITNDRYREELPVYETTRLDQNRAIL